MEFFPFRTEDLSYGLRSQDHLSSVEVPETDSVESMGMIDIPKSANETGMPTAWKWRNEVE